MYVKCKFKATNLDFRSKTSMKKLIKHPTQQIQVPKHPYKPQVRLHPTQTHPQAI